MFKIGDFSKLTFVSIRNLRYYDEIGLFKPIKVDTFTNYRYYSASQIPVLNTIVALKQLGFNSDEVRHILATKDTEEGKTILRAKLTELDRKLKRDQYRLEQLSHYITHYNEETSNMKYDVVIKDIPGMKVVSLKKVIPAYDQEYLLWQEMMQKSQEQTIQFGPRCTARFHEEPNENGAEVEICNEVIELQENKDGLTFYELEPIKGAATLLIVGPYSPGIKDGFNYMAKWLEDNHYQFAGPSRTDYIKGPGIEEDPENYLTEIIIPIRKVA
jgi:DNA-binding transcriptional MerR regulator/effector-binding domain-containing protein